MESTISAEQIASDRSTSVYAAAIVTFTLASLVVPLRIFARRLTSANFWWDDWFIFVAYFFASVVFASSILWLKNGLGKHVEVVAASNPDGITTILKSFAPAEIAYTLSICFSKYSVLAFYWRIFGVTQMRTVLVILAFVVTGWGISVVVVSAVTCVPLSALWNPEIHGKCVDSPKFYFAVSVLNATTDWIILITPLSHIWKLQMPTNQKIVATGLFVVGGFVCVVSLVRLVFVAHLDLVDLTWALANLDLWTCIETFSAVFCACLPSLRPICNVLIGKPTKTRQLGGNTTNIYERSKTNKSTSIWNYPNKSSEPGRFTRLRDKEAWPHPTTTTSPNNETNYVVAEEQIEMDSVTQMASG